MRKPRLLALTLTAAVLAAVACSDATGPSTPGAPSLSVVSGDAQQGVAGTELPQPLVVKVTDARGKPVSGQLVSFVVAAGGGRMFAGAALTNAAGEAQDRWTLGTVAADSQRVEARAVDPSTGQPLVFGVFRATAVPGAPASIAAAGNATFTGVPGTPLPDSVAAVVRDRWGNPVPNSAVVWSVKQGGGSAAPLNTSTDAQGVARTRWTLGLQLDSTQVLQANAGLTISTQFTANARVPADARLAVVSGDAQTGTVGQTLPQPLVLKVQHADGTGIPGIPVTFSLTAQDGSVNPATAVSDTGGRVTVRWTLGTKVGTMRVVAELPNSYNAGFSATAVAGAPASLQAVTPASVQVPIGGTTTMTVRVLDAFGNTAPGSTVAWSAAAGSVSPASTVADAGGQASTTYIAPGAAAQTTVQATAGTATATFSVKVGGPSLSIALPHDGATVGDTLQLMISAWPEPGESLVRVMATVGGTTVQATALPTAVSPNYVAVFPLAGNVAPGTFTARAWAVSTSGDSTVDTRQYTYVPTPRLSVSAPLQGAVIRNGQAHVTASCVHCVWVHATLRAEGGQTLGDTGPLLDGSYDVSAQEGNTAVIEFTAANSAGVVRSVLRQVYVASSPALTESAAAGVRVLDTDATRVLYYDSVNALHVRTLADGADQVVAPSGGIDGRLVPSGVLWMAGTNSADTHLYDWRGGGSTDLGEMNSLEVAGNWAIWSDGATLYRRDLAAGTNTVISTTAAKETNDVGDNGLVAYWSASFDVHVSQGGADQVVSTSAGLQNSDVVTDGTNVLWRKGSPTGTVWAIAHWSGGTETVVAPNLPFGAAPHVSYDANNGWWAYVNTDGAGVQQLFSVSPDGTTRQVTSGGGNALLAALGPNGDVVYLKLGRWYAVRAPYTGAPVDLGTPLQYGRLKFQGTTLQLLLGRSVFTVSY